jgi:hypothetical protein
VHLIVPGHYKAPISVRAAAKFAQSASIPPAETAGLGAFGRRSGGKVAVLALVALALFAAGGVGTALAFRFGRAHHAPAPAPAATDPAP